VAEPCASLPEDAESVDSSSFAPAVAWLLHPLTVLATVVLLVNDHVMKAAAPGWVTGKASDVAGLLVAPPLLALAIAALVPRLAHPVRVAFAVSAVGVVFAVVKANVSAAHSVSELWSVLGGQSVIRADASDLAAVPALGLAWWIGRPADVSPRRRARSLGLVVVLPTAALAVAATSAPYNAYATGIAVWGDRLIVQETYGSSLAHALEPDPTGALSPGNQFDGSLRETRDDGLTFRRLDRAAGDLAADPTAVRWAGTRDCSAVRPEHCFRTVAGRLGVQESTDGGLTWAVAWEVPEFERVRLARQLGVESYDQAGLASLVLVVRDQAAGGVVVLVANGRDGFARRDASGNWQRLGFGVTVADPTLIGGPPEIDSDPAEAVPALTPLSITWFRPAVVGWSLLTAGAILMTGIAVAGTRRRWRAGWVGPALAALALPVMGGLSADGELFTSVGLLAFGALLVGLGTLVTLIIGVHQGVVRAGGLARLTLPALAGAAGVLTPTALWLAHGWPEPRLGFLLSTVAVVTSWASAGALGRRLGRPGPPARVTQPDPR
jgi:hypothetical protein